MSLATTLGQSRFHGSDQPTEEIRLTRRTLRPAPPGWSGWSPRTQLALAGLGLLTAVLGTVLVVQVVSAQDLRADGRADGAALTTALEAARADVAALADAIEAAGPAVSDARALSDLLTPRAGDLSAEAVEGVTAAADALGAAVAAPAVEPTLPAWLGSPSGLAERYVSADGDELRRLRDQVAFQLERLPDLGADADARVAGLDAARADVATAAAGAVQAAQAATPRILAAGPEATPDARTRLEQAVAALAALGDAPAPDAATRTAFTAYFSAADGFRLSHEQAVAARLAAEQAAAEAAAAAADEEAARQAQEEEPWWRDWWKPGNGRDRP
ncbi:hypothetical protein [Actinotalea fermentans]|uniref:Uncharacterized protein n=1 Tax=Actinotalea fermentans TaxID=43671 RepID=A0A511YYP8_9CELL|nr:hypothetical protein [Actinotalea fermentans]GEN80331.1 hypothetical protein AFE02nite_20650 [Actinotalea fermentans]